MTVNCALRSLLKLSGLSMVAQRLFQTVHAEAGIHAVADLPAQHLVVVPDLHCHQVDKALSLANVGDDGAPVLVGALVIRAKQKLQLDQSCVCARMVLGWGSAPPIAGLFGATTVARACG